MPNGRWSFWTKPRSRCSGFASWRNPSANQSVDGLIAPALADSFESAVGEIVETVSSAATELEASANGLTTLAERSQQLATPVAAASEQASTNVQSAASPSEERTSSVDGIDRQVRESPQAPTRPV